MAATPYRSPSARRSVSITYPARLTEYRSPGWPRRKPRWRAIAGTQPYEAAGRNRAVGIDRRGDRRRCPDQGSRASHATAAPHHLFGPDPGAVGAADQSRSGHRAAGRSVTTAVATERNIPDP